MGREQTPVPDHLLGISDEEMKKFRKTFDDARKAKSELTKVAAGALANISRSDDGVSKRLEPIFQKAVPPNDGELQRARERRERGNPPGKSNDPLGDQIIWEQFLSHCKGKNRRRLWILSRDQDYCTEFGGRVFLNAFLHQELKDVCGATAQIYCFTDLLEGLKDFGKNAGVKAEKVPTGAEADGIRKEIDRLPSSQWYLNDQSHIAAALIASGRQRLNPAILSNLTSFASPFQDIGGTLPRKNEYEISPTHDGTNQNE
jgi:hypothetical protein